MIHRKNLLLISALSFLVILVVKVGAVPDLEADQYS